MRILILLLAALGALAVTLMWGQAGVRAEDGAPRFESHEACALCHDATRRGTAMQDAAGRDVAPVSLWQSSMMANASRDPLWRAVVEWEAAATPTRAEEIRALCRRCHAPMSSGGQDLAADGVSCTVCHQIVQDGLGEAASFSGGFRISTDDTIFGPHETPFTRPMQHHTGYTPVASDHVLEPALCGTCHTLFTEALEPDGSSAGARHAEQTPYLEWRNSAYSTEVETRGPHAATCRDCHLPTTDEDGTPIRTRIAHNPGGRDFPPTRARAPFGRHVLVGGNALVPRLLRDAAPAPAQAFDATLASVGEQLARAGRLTIPRIRHDADRLSIDVCVQNLTGHRLPSAHPTRRVWVALEILDEAGNVVFASGAHDADGRIVGADGEPLPFERADGPVAPHRDRIEGADQVALYEAQMADVRGEPTWLLTRGAIHLKDDRLLPLGWREDGPHADEIPPRGVEADADFRGGSDVVHYEIPLDLPVGAALTVRVRLLHQTVGARWAAEWRAGTSENPGAVEPTEALGRVLDAADLRPSEIASITIEARPVVR